MLKYCNLYIHKTQIKKTNPQEKKKKKLISEPNRVSGKIVYSVHCVCAKGHVHY